MKKIYFFVLMLTSMHVSLAQPVIYSFTPGTGPVGTIVTINGTNFNSRPVANVVYFGATRAKVIAATTTTLQVLVPTGAAYKPITVMVKGLMAYSDKPFIVTFNGSDTGFTQESFAAKINFIPGTYPGTISAADLDCDGKPDMVTDNQFSNSISVFRNMGTPGNILFAGKMDFPTGSQPFGNSIGDLNGDGKQDIVVANFSSNTISVFKNLSLHGVISFDTKVDFVTGIAPNATFMRDLDADGKPEMAVCNGQSHTVSVYKNTSVNGVISFDPKVDYATEREPSDVALSDLDGDGKPDMVIANFDGNSLSVFKNTSTGGTLSFALPLNIPSNGYSESVAFGDLDGDGKPDLAVALVGPNRIAVFRNTSTPGNISFAKQVNYVVETDARRVSLTDLNGDGKVDIAVTSQRKNLLSLFSNKSTPGIISFATRVDYATEKSPSGIALTDFDGDGKADIAVTNSNAHTVSVFRNIIDNSATVVSNASITSKIRTNTNVNVLPNPGTGNFSLLVTLPHKQLATTLSIYDNYGRKIWQQQQGLIGGNFYKTLFLQNSLAAGSYILAIERSDIKLEKRIVVVK